MVVLRLLQSWNIEAPDEHVSPSFIFSGIEKTGVYLCVTNPAQMKIIQSHLRPLLFCFVLLIAGAASAQTVMFDKTISVGSYGGDAILSSTGNYYVATHDLVTSFSPSGVVQWTVDLQFPQLGITKIIEVDSELVLAGNMVTGQIWSFFLMKLDAQHNVLWMHVYGRGINSYAQLQDVCRTSDDEYVLAGYTVTNGPLLIKTNSTGTPIWTFTGNNTVELFRRVAEASDHTLLVACGSSTVLKLDTAGTLLWQHAYHEGPGYGPGYISGIAEVPGGYIFTGVTYHTTAPGGVDGFKIVRTDLSGNMLSGTCLTDTTSGWALMVGRGYAVKDSGMLLIIDRNQTFSGGQIVGGVGFIDTAGSLRWTRQYTTMWSVFTPMADTGIILLGGSELNPNNYGLMKTNPSGVGQCPSSPITLVHGPTIIDTGFNLGLFPALVSDTTVTFIVTQMNTIFTFPNCIAADIPGQKVEGLMIYPNPVTNGSFMITGVSGSGQLIMRNQLGQIVHTQQISAFPATVNLSLPLSSGMYTIEIAGAEKTTRSRVIIQ